MAETDNKIDEDFANAIIDYLDYKFDKVMEKKIKLVFNQGFELGLEQGLEQGSEQTYLRMIFKGMDPRLIGCSEELFQKLYEKAKQMNN